MPRAAAPTYAYTPATLPPNHVVVRLGPPRGSHNFDATDAAGVARLVELPAKVRRVSYAARGSFSIVQLHDPAQGAVAGEIVHIVTAPELKQWRRTGEWPKAFDDAPADEDKDGNGDEDEDELPANTNRRYQVRAESSSDEDESGDESEGEDEEEDAEA
ncbi:hypothetical protein Q5752_000410 [Cryptotrichosporon argae]